MARLDWDRSYKTAYEIACIESATHAAASAHRGARAAFEDGASELQIHHAYMQALEATDDELPYPSIIAMNEKAAYLHYLGKRRVTDGDVVLIDSGAAHLGYACDITRTWTRPGTDPVFVELVAALNRVQQALCAAVEPGLAAVDLHRLADRLIADALHEADLIAVGGEEAVGRALTRAFFPHGFGHPLGLQVHDVAGRQATRDGGEQPPPPDYPSLRTTRTFDPGQVFTVEPGIYFIEMLLERYRAGPDAAAFNWSRIDTLTGLGGARIEDNVVITHQRPPQPDPRGPTRVLTRARETRCAQKPTSLGRCRCHARCVGGTL